MSNIQRYDLNARMSRVVIHGDVVYLSGITPKDTSGDIAAQTRDILQTIDGYLEQAGTSKSRLLTAQIWLRDIDRDFEGMNQVWESWVDKENVPTRATCEARLAAPDILVEIIVTAAL
ncbi:MAG TPA: RidA family protein [Burkholderiaceae bacterium]|nr:RidA family protein [Burkholderiaceae bacterium]